MIVNVLGYILGWYLAKLYGFSYLYKITLMIELGMQNAGMGMGMGMGMALQHFPAESALPGALFAVWCILTAAIVSGWLRRRIAKQQMEKEPLTTY